MALGVGVWDNIQTRKHNRLSVVPHLVFILELQSSASDATGVETGGAGSEPEGAGTEAVPRGAEAGAPDAAASRVAPPLQTASLTLRNEGVGPAVIDSVRILVDRSDGRPACFASLNDAEEALAALDERVRIEATTHVSRGSSWRPGGGSR